MSLGLDLLEEKLFTQTLHSNAIKSTDKLAYIKIRCERLDFSGKNYVSFIKIHVYTRFLSTNQKKYQQDLC